jgi:hypothetical protein
MINIEQDKIKLEKDLKEARSIFFDCEVAIIKSILKILSPKDRINFFNQITEDYCYYCGSEKTGVHKKCHCMNDD